MSKKKCGPSTHAMIRCKERTNFSRKTFLQIEMKASRYGLSALNIEPGPLREYMKRRDTRKRVKYYKGYVFVYAKNSTALITMWQVPEEVLLADSIYCVDLKNISKNDLQFKLNTL